MSTLDEIRARIPNVPAPDMSRAARDRARLLTAIDAIRELCDQTEKGRPQETDRPEDWMLDPEDVRGIIAAALEGAE